MFPRGTRFGPYELLDQLGAGGMGEVYSAHDPRLGRDVAIKVIAPGLAQNHERVRRFEQEACAAAGLAHPNIVAVHDVGLHEGSPFIVTELLEGMTLRALLEEQATRSGASLTPRSVGEALLPTPGTGGTGGAAASQPPVRGLSARKALDIARQVAQGLAAAHEKGIVHRDLKPENVFVTHDGRVKILDFGIAKLRDETPAFFSQTTTASGTAPGTVLGTVGYMAPEQLRGHVVDHRADIFALGAILYEMITGARAFARSTAIDVVSAILASDPPEVTTVAPGVPPGLEGIVMRCLEKRPEGRFQSASDLAFALEALPATAAPPPTLAEEPDMSRRGGAWRARLPWLVATVATVAALALLAVYARERASSDALAEPTFTDLEAPVGTRLHMERGLAVSPDGRHVAFVASLHGGAPQLWVRSLSQPDATVLTGTDDAVQPFWSRDSRSIAFFAQAHLKRVEMTGGPPVVICDVSTSPRGGTWGAGGDILFAPSIYGSIFRVSPAGGGPVRVTPPPTGTPGSHRYPKFLRDGRRFVFNDVDKGLTLWDLDQGKAIGTLPRHNATLQTVAEVGDQAYELSVVPVSSPTATGQADSALLARPLDLASFTTSGDPRTITSVAAAAGVAALAPSGSGTLGVVRAWPLMRLNVVDRQGAAVHASLPWTPLSGPRFSPDGTRIAFADRGEVAVFDVARRLSTPVTDLPGNQGGPIWSPDGTRLAFVSRGGEAVELSSIAVGGGSAPVKLVSGRRLMFPSDWSRDGAALAYTVWPDDSTARAEVWLYTFADGTSRALLAHSNASVAAARFSPDGRWIAYQSDETGRWEVYVRPYPGPGQPVRLSQDGGVQPVWRGDGRELYFAGQDGRVMAVGRPLGAFGGTAPVPLMPTAITAYWTIEAQFSLDAAPDGERFVLASDDSPTPVRSVTLIQNWPALLARQP